MYEAGIIVLIATIVVMMKLPTWLLRRLLWAEVIIDILATLSFISIFAGTYSGLMAAVVAGLAFSLVLAVTKKIVGYEKLTLTSMGWRWVMCK